MNTWYEIAHLWQEGIESLECHNCESTSGAAMLVEQFTVAELARLDQLRAKVQANLRVDMPVS